MKMNTRIVDTSLKSWVFMLDPCYMFVRLGCIELGVRYDMGKGK